MYRGQQDRVIPARFDTYDSLRMHEIIVQQPISLEAWEVKVIEHDGAHTTVVQLSRVTSTYKV